MHYYSYKIQSFSGSSSNLGSVQLPPPITEEGCRQPSLPQSTRNGNQ